jgi:DNA-binding transcriptional LysR family regulator
MHHRISACKTAIMRDFDMKTADWDDLKLFFHVATEGGLTGAAEITGLSAPTIGRRMLALERTTGRALFVRSQQGYRLAPDGEVLLEHVRAMQKTAEGIANWHKDAFAMPIVSVASDGWVSSFLADRALILRSKTDPYRLCCQSAHAGIDLTYRQADVGIVHQPPQSGNFAIQRSVKVTHAVYRARSLSESDDLTWISIGTESSHAPSDKWVFQNHEARIFNWTTTPDLLLRLIRSGSGRGVLPCFVGDAHADLIREGEIIEELSYEMWIVTNDDDRHRPEVREVIQRLVDVFKREEQRFAGIVSVPLKRRA